MIVFKGGLRLPLFLLAMAGKAWHGTARTGTAGRCMARQGKAG